jgi:hypothetical protein
MADEHFFFANKGTIAIAGVGGTPASQAVGVAKDVEIVVSSEHVPLYGWGSVKRQAVAKHTAKVSVKIGFAKFDPATSSTIWFPFYAISPTAGAVTSLMEDTNTVKLFDVTITLVNEEASAKTLTIVAKNVYFPSIPLKASEGNWVRVDLDGEGSDITYSFA